MIYAVKVHLLLGAVPTDGGFGVAEGSADLPVPVQGLKPWDGVLGAPGDAHEISACC